ncbi:MAG: hypothetical protein AAB784_02545 [Patescibacteria group bacterium]
MSFELTQNQTPQESTPKAKVEIESAFDSYVPEEFRNSPIKYFEEKGQNIKSGEVRHDETGRIREDPTAVKDFPVWKNSEGQELWTVGKRVNNKKAKVGLSGDPFYEYKIMEIAQELGLPAPRPVAKAEEGGSHFIVMERVNGIRWSDRDSLHLNEKGYSAEDIERLKKQAELMTEELGQKFEEAGIIRKWHAKDMIFDLDVEGKIIKAITPTDWERTTIDEERLARARAGMTNKN